MSKNKKKKPKKPNLKLMTKEEIDRERIKAYPYSI